MIKKFYRQMNRRKGQKLKVFTQNRNEIIDFPKKVWIVACGEKGMVVSTTATLDPAIGEYGNIDRAKEVLNDMLKQYKSGEKVYVMPEE